MKDIKDEIIDMLWFLIILGACFFLSYCPAPSNDDHKTINRQNNGTVSNFVINQKKMVFEVNQKPFNSLILLMVPKRGLEPPHLTVLDPKSKINTT